MRYIESDANQSMRGDKLEEAIVADKEKGLVPFWVSPIACFFYGIGII